MVLLSDKFPETSSLIDDWKKQLDFIHSFTSRIKKYVGSIPDLVLDKKYGNINFLKAYFTLLIN